VAALALPAAVAAVLALPLVLEAALLKASAWTTLAVLAASAAGVR
jgi:hypothetical protein